MKRPIYDELMHEAEQGHYFEINFKEKSLKIGSRMYIENGEIVVDAPLIGGGNQ